MKIKVLIVEDEVLVADDIAGSLEKDGYEVTGTAISGHECFESIAANPPHVILMDIHIKGAIDGIETAKKIQNIPIIFITSNTGQKYVSRALEVFPHAFISKPYNYQDVTVAVELAFNRSNERTLLSSKPTEKSDAIFVKKGNTYKKVLLDDVLYIEAAGSYCEVMTTTEKLILSFNLNHFQSNIHNPAFKRIHRSHVVNLSKVDRFDNGGVWVKDIYLPVSPTYKQEVFAFFNKLF